MASLGQAFARFAFTAKPFPVVPEAPPGPGGKLLLENSDYLMTEGSDNLTTET